MIFSLRSHSSLWEYREPFFGAGAVGIEILRNLHGRSKVWLNDKDRGMACLWRSVLGQPNELRTMIARFRPSTEAFYEFKRTDGDESLSELECGFRKLALHQMSVSGFGFKSGGPLGGRDQENATYKVHCRWNPQSLKEQVSRYHNILANFHDIKITCDDFEAVIGDVPKECFIYLDPPYVDKGPELYKHSMSDADHRRLASMVRSLRCGWVLSYDDHSDIRELYSWAKIEELEVVYTNATNAIGRRPKNREVVITPATSM
jgi:DNA adenine methylase